MPCEMFLAFCRAGPTMLPRGQAKASALWAYSSAAEDCPRLAAKPCARQSLDPFLMMATTKSIPSFSTVNTFQMSLQFRTTWGLDEDMIAWLATRSVIDEFPC